MTDKCYYGEHVCSGEIWECETCGESFCQVHFHETELGRNVECVACEQARKEADDLGDFAKCDICKAPFEAEDGMATGYTIEDCSFSKHGTERMYDSFHGGYLCYGCIRAAWDAAVKARGGGKSK